MKTFTHIALALASLLALSCVKEAQPEHNEETVTVQYGVTVDTATKALGDGKTANYVWYALYRADGSLVSECTTPAKIDADRKAICPVTMAKDQDYKVVFLAMYYDEVDETKIPAYDISAMGKTITIPSSAQANSDKLDLFYGVDEVEDFKGAQNTNVTLNRIVAQVNFELSEEAWNTLGVDSSFKSQIAISGAPAVMYLWDGTLSGTASMTYAMSTIPAEGRKIGTAYCFASRDGDQKVNVSISLFNASGTEVKTVFASAVPVAVNKQTNLIIN